MKWQQQDGGQAGEEGSAALFGWALISPTFPNLIPAPDCASEQHHPCFPSASHPAFPQEDSSVTHTRCKTQPWILTGCWKNAHSRANGGNWEISAGTSGFGDSQRQPKGLVSLYLLMISLFPGPCAPYSDSRGTSEVG